MELLTITDKYKQYFIITDQNYDLLKASAHQPTQDFFDMLIQREFLPSILKPTRITHRSSTLIDNIYVKSNPINQSRSYVIEDGMSDHYACFVSYIVKRDKLRDTPVTLNR